METRRTEVLRAAVEVLGGGGSRALTHRAVDTAGDLPAGTTSNHFRSRDALVAGALEYILATESARYEQLRAAGDASGDEQIVRDASEMLRYLAGPARPLALARHAIVLEAALRPELRGVLMRASEVWWAAVADRLRDAVIPEPHAAARQFLACLDGLLLDQLCHPDCAFEPEIAIHALLEGMRGRFTEGEHRPASAPG